MFNHIFIEEDIKEEARTKKVLTFFKNSDISYIDEINNYFGRVKKPYLQKRDNLNLYLGHKKGQLVKEAPDAYGVKGEPHYYFIHAYNCIYECTYCYLQGFFNSPDIVLFLNHEDIGKEITNITNENLKLNPSQSTWFHAGEYSDSLALSHITGEIPYYFELFKSLPQARLEFRTKSANVRPLLEMTPLPNIITSFSLSPQAQVKNIDLKTPPLKTRLKAIEKLVKAGHPIGIHFDPIVYHENFETTYRHLVASLIEVLPAEKLEYISLGVVRFTRDVYAQVKKNYPDSELLSQEFVKSFDNKIRYNRPMRLWILKTVQNICMEYGISKDKIYLCMENGMDCD